MVRRTRPQRQIAPRGISTFRVRLASRNDNKEGYSMPVVLDPDSIFVYKAFQEAGRPPFETVTPAEARELYLAGRVATNPEPPELESARELSIPAPHGSI